MKKRNPKKKATLLSIAQSIDDLAIITKQGFDTTVSKTEFGEFKTEMTEFKTEMTDFKTDMTDFKKGTEKTLFALDNHAQETNRRLNAIEKTLGPLIQVSAVMEKEIRNLNIRVSRLEHKAGIK